MSTSAVYKHYLRAISLWPKDPIRPEVQFRDALRRRVDRHLLPASVPPSSGSHSQSSNSANSALTVAVDESAELEQINALYGLLEGRYEKKYPLQNSLLTPQSKPNHYADLVKELDEAPTRSFWARLSNQWRGFARFE